MINNNEIIGRIEEKALLESLLSSERPELMAVYGRRRVGKTYLIRTYLKEQIKFEFSGIHGISTDVQLHNFTKALSTQLNDKLPLQAAATWFDAFDLLGLLLAKKRSRKKMVIFLDEFPWMQTSKSDFLPAFEQFWNIWASLRNNIAVILCGSAASWMIHNIVRNRGGLHNRITRKMPLYPFSLYETELFLKSRGTILNRYQISQLYMVMGGIPHYLEQAGQGKSAAQIIDKECFTPGGFLTTEFQDLYMALFDSAEKHLKVIRALAAKPMGLNRNEIIKTCKLQTGGTITLLLEELASSGFITPYIPFGKKIKDVVYKLTDPYSLFYLKFIESNKNAQKGTWAKLSDTPSWKSWSGLAFETICLQHQNAIKKALGIAGIYSEASIWRSKPSTENGQAQIDLLLDRRDHCITIFEMKYYSEKFALTSKGASELQRKISVFKQTTGTKKQIFMTMITMFGIRENEYSIGCVDQQLTIDDLFV